MPNTINSVEIMSKYSLDQIDLRRRTMAKAVSWRIFGTLITASVAWAVTGRLRFAASIGVVDAVLKLGAYYMHERAWNRISYGRVRSPEYQI